MPSPLRAVRTTVLVSLAASWLSVATAARGDPTPNEVRAENLYNSAKEHMARNEYAVACDELRESDDLDPQVGTELNLAYCYEQIGRTASAWSTWLKAAAAATAKGETERADVASVRAPRVAYHVCVPRSPLGSHWPEFRRHYGYAPPLKPVDVTPFAVSETDVASTVPFFSFVP